MTLRSLRTDYFFWILLGAAVGFAVLHPGRVFAWPALVNWHTIAALAGLLILSTGVRQSGLLHGLGVQLVPLAGSVRNLALLLVTGTLALAAVLTNDVTLFIVVPLTLGLHESGRLPIGRLIVFEALAANAGSMLTPIGNPQNLFLWQRAGVGFLHYTAAMFPPFAIVSVLLILLTTFAFPGRRLHASESLAVPLDRKLAGMSITLLPVFVIAADNGYAILSLGVLAIMYLSAFRDVLKRVDWPLLVVFVLMFIDLRLLAAQTPVTRWIEHLNLQATGHLYVTGVLGSQAISNVPMAILLAQYSSAWKTIAFGVNVGGFGAVTGSVANLIALRLGGGRRLWLTFHGWSLPFLLLAAAAVYAWLLWAGCAPA